MEEEETNNEERYIDLSNCFEPKKEEPVIEEKEEPVIEEKKQVVSNYKEKKSKKNNTFMFILIALILVSLGTSAYVTYDNHYLKRNLDNPQLIYSGDWDCFTEKCTEYMTLNEWSKDNCNDDLTECKINYQGQDVILPFKQIQLPPEHELLCKKYICSTEIPIRRYTE